MFGVSLQLPGEPSADRILEILDAGALAHMHRLLEGRKLPCCPRCAGLRYRPKDYTAQQCYYCSDLAFTRGVVSCEEASMLVAGWYRARAVKQGATYDAARKSVRLLATSTGPRAWHITVATPGKMIDPTKGLRAA